MHVNYHHIKYYIPCCIVNPKIGKFGSYTYLFHFLKGLGTYQHQVHVNISNLKKLLPFDIKF